jgi:hypothetical protein
MVVAQTVRGLESDIVVHPYGVHRQGVSWAAVFAGAIAAASLSVIVAFLGLGLGMSAISPWAGQGASAATIGVSSILWLTLTQVAAAALGGYLAGRLRHRWVSVHADEVYFRDTVHGFLAWGVSTLVVGAFFAATLAGIAGLGAKAVGSAAGVAATAGAAAAGANASRPAAEPPLPGWDYAVDMALRQNSPGAAQTTSSTESGISAAPAQSAQTTDLQRSEVSRIFRHAIDGQALSQADIDYLARQIAQRSGVSLAEAQVQVREAYEAAGKAVADAKDAADKARKATAYTSLWLFIALLGGAFFASYTAQLGGRRRDLDL